MQAYATTDGTLRWQFSTDDDHYHFPIGTTRDSLIVFSRKNKGKKKDETTYALSLGDGHVRWQYDHPTRTMGDHHIAYDTVYFSTSDGTIQAITSPGKSQLYDTLRTVVSPIGLATSGLLGAALFGGGYHLYRRDDGEGERESDLSTWNGYELIEQLDDETYLARTAGGDDVRLRRFRDPPGNFERDAQEWAMLDDDGAQGVHDWGIDSNPWIAVEHVSGQPLTNVSGEIDQQSVVDIVAGVAEVVHHGHGKGVFHEALSPENVVVTDFGVRVTNWRFTDSGDSREESVPADVQRLGELAWSMLSGEPSESLRDVLETATASKPDERYESALEFADMLRWTMRSN